MDHEVSVYMATQISDRRRLLRYAKISQKYYVSTLKYISLCNIMRYHTKFHQKYHYFSNLNIKPATILVR